MLVVIRGAGDLASGIALRLWRSGLKIVMLDLPEPTAIRRTVCFSQALRYGKTTVEDTTAVRAETTEEVRAALENGTIPVLPDPEAACLSRLRPDVLVDAILAKRNLGTKLTDAPLVVGVGPGFTAGKDCHAVVETMRGHTLGRVIREGAAIPNTNVPGLIGGFAGERVLRAPADGIFHQILDIGAMVQPGETAGEVNGLPMTCTIGGVLRGILPDGTPVKAGMKSGDVDPRGVLENCYTASDKALAVGGGVLQAILEYTGVLKGCRGENTLGV
jgi:xanthine dehydrogenase accessory factor